MRLLILSMFGSPRSESSQTGYRLNTTEEEDKDTILTPFHHLTLVIILKKHLQNSVFLLYGPSTHVYILQVSMDVD